MPQQLPFRHRARWRLRRNVDAIEEWIELTSSMKMQIRRVLMAHAFPQSASSFAADLQSAALGATAGF